MYERIIASDDYADLFDDPFADEVDDPSPDDTLEEDDDGQPELEQAFEALGLRPRHLDSLNTLN
jgi:hypothetical protein